MRPQPLTRFTMAWSSTTSIIDVVGRKLHATVLLDDVDNGAANPWAVAVSPDSKTVYVTHSGTHELSVIDVPGMMAAIEAHDGDPSNQLSFLYDVRRRIRLLDVAAPSSARVERSSRRIDAFAFRDV